MGDDQQPLTAENVAAFLVEQPDFFQQHPEVLEQIELANAPEGTISLAQRQTENLRKKSRQLQDQLESLLGNAKSNSELQDRVHQLCLSLMDMTSMEALLVCLVEQLKQEFSAEFVAIRLFNSNQMHFQIPSLDENVKLLAADDDSIAVFENVLAKQQPVCGRLTQAQKNFLFDEQVAEVASVACIPLGKNKTQGLMAIASSDPNRFHANMGTVYLSFLGEVVIRLIRQHNS